MLYSALCGYSIVISVALNKIVIEDIFGDRANEKEIDSITKKLREAKNKSYGTSEILATYASKDSIGHILLPLKKVQRKFALKFVLKFVDKRLFIVNFLFIFRNPNRYYVMLKVLRSLIELNLYSIEFVQDCLRIAILNLKRC